MSDSNATPETIREILVKVIVGVSEKTVTPENAHAIAAIAAVLVPLFHVPEKQAAKIEPSAGGR